METPEKPKKKQNLASIGITLIIGGTMVLWQRQNTDALYERLGDQGSSVPWAQVIGWLLIGVGGSLVLRGLAAMFGSKD